MKGKSFIKRLTIFSSMITLAFVLNSSSINKKSKDYFRSTTKITKNKIDYNDGTIFIGNKYYLSKIKDINSNDILVLDQRYAHDPNFKIIESYKINNSDIREEIIEALLYYEELYPSRWNRTKNSLLREWTTHNIMHFFGYELDHTTDVDLNNGDEEKYRVKKYISNE